MKDKLKNYLSGDNYTSILNLFLSNRDKDLYGELGKYISDKLDIKNIKSFDYHYKKLEKVYNEKEISTIYSNISILFLTSVLCDKSLKNMFGEPLYHSEFGEGFDDEQEDIKAEYASYFINILDSDFHIGYDHRGTAVEMKIESDIIGLYSESEINKCFNSLKAIVDLYKLKN